MITSLLLVAVVGTIALLLAVVAEEGFGAV